MKIEISNGELFDKVSILQIKKKKIKDKMKLKNIKREYDMLYPLLESFDLDFVSTRIEYLVDVNTEIWEVEEILRKLESEKSTDSWMFIEAARDACRYNDRRFLMKDEINKTTESNISEEKNHNYDILYPGVKYTQTAFDEMVRSKEERELIANGENPDYYPVILNKRQYEGLPEFDDNIIDGMMKYIKNDSIM